MYGHVVRYQVHKVVLLGECDRLTLKISSPLLRRRALLSSVGSGGGSKASGSGVSMRSFRPYLCGLSSGRGEGAGMVGDRAEARGAGTGGSSSSCSLASSIVAWKEILFSLPDETTVVVALDCLLLPLCMSTVMVESECRIIGSRALWAGSINGSIGLSSCSGGFRSVTTMDVAVSGRGSGDLESIRLKRFVELLRRTRIGRRRTTLLSDASSGSGEPFTLEGLLPMARAGVLGARFLGLGRGTCVFVAQASV